MVDPESITGTLDIRWEYTLDGMQVHFSIDFHITALWDIGDSKGYTNAAFKMSQRKQYFVL